jgi:hypothetical protein
MTLYPKFLDACFASNVYAAFAPSRFRRPTPSDSMVRTPCGKTSGAACSTMGVGTAAGDMRKTVVGRVGGRALNPGAAVRS